MIFKKPINRDLSLLILGRLVSDIGSSIHMMIMPLYIIDSGNAPSTVGLFAFLSLIPTLLIYPFAGVIGDRINRKKIMVVADAISALVLLLLYSFAKLGDVNILVLLLAQTLISACFGFFDPATKGMIPKLVQKDDLAKTNSLVAAMRIVSGLVAPMIAVLLYTKLGIAVLFLINGLSFIFSATTELLIKYKHKKSTEKIGLKLVVKDLAEGSQFILHNSQILKMSLYFLIVFAFIHPIFAVILPVFYRTQLSYSNNHYGILQMILLTGAFAGTIMVGKLSKGDKIQKVLKGGIVTMSISALLLTLVFLPGVITAIGNSSMSYFLMMACLLCLLYISIMFIHIPVQTIIQKATPDAYMSRVFSMVSLISKGGVPLGALLYGLLLEKMSIHMAVISAVSVVLAISIIFLIRGNGEKKTLHTSHVNED